MFWRFGGYASISTIDTLLDKPDVALEDLLDEPEIIQELKQHNTKLIEYLREDHVLKRLMDHVIAPSLLNDDDDEEDEDEKNDNDAHEKNDSEAADVATAPAEEMDSETKGQKPARVTDSLRSVLDPEDLEKVEKTRLKHAYVACEILSSETWSILESIMANPAHLREFWGFVRRSAPLDSLQASYFTKVNETLLDKKTEEMLEFLKSLDGIVAALLQHVDNPMVMDLLLKIISLEKADGGQGTVDWLQSQNLVPLLLSFLSPEQPGSVQTSAGDFLKAIITISANATPNDQSCIGPNSLTRQLVSPELVQQLINAMLKGGNPLTVGVGIVIEVIRKNNSDYDPEQIGGPDSMPTPYDPIYLGHLLRLFAKHIPDFMTLIQSSKHTVHDGTTSKSVERGRLNSAWGASIEPLGFDRFKTCELMAELLHCSNMGLLNEPGSEDYVRQRNEERDRLIRGGVFGHHRDEQSGMEYNDTTADFTNGSTMETDVPEDANPKIGDDESFEKVGTSGDSVGEKNEEKDSSTHSDSQQPSASHVETSTETTGPSSPKTPTTALSEQISDIKLEEQDSHKEDMPAESDSSVLAVTAAPGDVPPPLFASKEAEAEAEAGQKMEGISESKKDDEPLKDGGAEDSADQYIQYDLDGRPVVGDFLKIMFVENQVVPTILGFFFRFPWNNFLHNVVYDVVQQVFNGPMERGYNRALAINVFETGKITNAIVEGQKRSDETQRTKQIRLGYMGHLTLVAEEVVKFSERHPPELLSRAVMEAVLDPEWIEYVEQTLSETRERDNAILGGVRPDMAGGHRQTSANNSASSQGFGGSSALADASTHLQTGNTGSFPNGSTPESLQSADHTQQGQISTNSSDDPYGPRRWSSSMVELSGKDRALNEFSVERVGEEAEQHLVMLHGYGAGLGFFYKNFEPLSRLKGWQLHALDMLGMGRSTRPPFKIKAKEREEAIREAEAWFVDALEEWRIKRKIDRFTLLGHSLGGYMAVAYALKYPGHLNKLILASPVGIPEDPYAMASDVTEPSDSTLVNEVTQDQQEITASAAVPGSAPKTTDGSFITGRNPEPGAAAVNRPPRRNMPKWFAYLWDANISPFSLVRWSGPLGPRIVSGWTSRRFSHLPADEAKALHDYSYSIFSQRGSGEYALAYILAPGAFARSPLIRRIHGVGRQMIAAENSPLPNPASNPSSCSLFPKPPSPPADPQEATEAVPPSHSTEASAPRRENGIPIVFMYGDHDWMDVSGGHAAAARLEEEKQRTLANAPPEEREKDQGSSKVVVISRAGHHLYLDGWKEFNKVVLAEMEEVSQREKRT